MNAKEALQVLIDNLEYPCDKEYDIVWNDLNRLEKLDDKINKLKKDYVELEHDRDTYRTAYRNELEIRNTNPNTKEALRVILTKRVNVKRFIEAKTFKDYNENLRESEQLTKSEFFNLKETIFVCVLS